MAASSIWKILMFLGTCTMNILGKSMVSTMDGRNPVPVGRWAVYPMISHDLQCFMVTHSYPAWCRIACPQFNNFQQKPPCFLVKSPLSHGFNTFQHWTPEVHGSAMAPLLSSFGRSLGCFGPRRWPLGMVDKRWIRPIPCCLVGG